MKTSKDLAKKIVSMFPYLDSDNNHLHVHFDKELNAWDVDVIENNHCKHTYIDVDEADACLDKDKCLALGIQVGELHVDH